jgi:cell division protein FtsA
MLKNLPQLVKYKTAMDVRIGLPNVHLTGKAREEINQPMYATSVGLILKGLEYLEENKTKLRFGEKKQEQAASQSNTQLNDKEGKLIAVAEGEQTEGPGKLKTLKSCQKI